MKKIRVGIDTPFVEPVDDTEDARRVAIKEAMTIAVRGAEPGDVIYQEDVTFSRDPFQSPLFDGVITMLSPRTSSDPRHWCPRAFRFATINDQYQILDAWKNSPERVCIAWEHIPKEFANYASHPGKGGS